MKLGRGGHIIGEGKKTIDLLKVTNNIHHINTSPWMGIKLTPLVVICTDSQMNGSYIYDIQTLQDILCILSSDDFYFIASSNKSCKSRIISKARP